MEVNDGALQQNNYIKINALFGGIVNEQKSFDWCEIRPARHKPSLVMLRTIQSGSIVVGVGPSPAWSLGKWRCSVREHAALFAVILLRSTDSKKSDMLYHLYCFFMQLNWGESFALLSTWIHVETSLLCSVRESISNKPHETCETYC